MKLHFSLALGLATSVALAACQTGAPYVVPGIAATPPKPLFALPDFSSPKTTAPQVALGAPSAPVQQSGGFSLSQYASGKIDLSQFNSDISDQITPSYQEGAPRVVASQSSPKQSLDYEVLASSDPALVPVSRRIDNQASASITSDGPATEKPRKAFSLRNLVTAPFRRKEAGEAATPASVTVATTPQLGGLDAVLANEPEMKLGSKDYAHAVACKSKVASFVTVPPSGHFDQASRREVLNKWRTCVGAKSMQSLVNP